MCMKGLILRRGQTPPFRTETKAPPFDLPFRQTQGPECIEGLMALEEIEGLSINPEQPQALACGKSKG